VQGLSERLVLFFILSPQLDVPKLGNKAVKYLKTQITVENVIEQLFGKFTTWSVVTQYDHSFFISLQNLGFRKFLRWSWNFCLHIGTRFATLTHGQVKWRKLREESSRTPHLCYWPSRGGTDCGILTFER
jgi:hypothetical protein